MNNYLSCNQCNQLQHIQNSMPRITGNVFKKAVFIEISELNFFEKIINFVFDKKIFKE